MQHRASSFESESLVLIEWLSFEGELLGVERVEPDPPPPVSLLLLASDVALLAVVVC